MSTCSTSLQGSCTRQACFTDASVGRSKPQVAGDRTLLNCMTCVLMANFLQFWHAVCIRVQNSTCISMSYVVVLQYPSVAGLLRTKHIVHSCQHMVNDIALTHHPDRQGDKRMPDSCSIGLCGCTCLQTLDVHNARVSACSSQACA